LRIILSHNTTTQTGKIMSAFNEVRYGT
jgi:hypothetical protein